MARFLIIGVIIAVAFILYALVDAAMSDPSRARGVSKPVWVVIVVVLPVIGGLLWFMIGKGRGPAPAPAKAPDDDPRFASAKLSDEEIDAHVAELEARLRELDEETFPSVDGDADQAAGDESGGAAQADTAAKPDTTARPEGDGTGEAR